MGKKLNIDPTYLLRNAVAPADDPNTLRVTMIEPKSYVAGPGVRTVIWVAGCLRRCPGCSLPQFFSFRAGNSVTIVELAEQILQNSGIDGVTYSGGEPFEHVLPLANLSRLLRSKGLNIASYSGYTLEALQSEPERFGPLLNELHLLIDGEFRQGLAGPYLWRGSANQRVHWLNMPAPPDPGQGSPDRRVQVSVEGKHVRISGFPSQYFRSEIAAQLERRGIILKDATA